MKPLALIGGSSLKKEVELFKTASKTVLVSTVGRLFNVLNDVEASACFDASKLKVLVIDEADRVLDSSHSGVQLSFILQKISKQRRTGLFSATMSAGIREVVKAGMRNPYYVEVRPHHHQNKVKVRELTLAEVDKIDDEEEKHQVPETLALHFRIFEKQSEKLPYLMGFAKAHCMNGGGKAMVFLSCCASVEYHHWVFRTLMNCVPAFKLHRKLP